MGKVDKVIDRKSAIDLIKSGDTLMVGGFGLTGCPANLLFELAERDLQHLNVISQGILGGGNAYWADKLVEMLERHMIDSFTTAFVGNQKVLPFVESGQVKLNFSPMGVLGERIKAGGAGLGGFYSPVGVGTIIAEGKELREIDGKQYIFETPLHANVSLIKAHKADHFGNAQLAYTAANFNPPMATAGDIVILECEELVETGSLHPNFIHIPGVFVDYVVECKEVRF